MKREWKLFVSALTLATFASFAVTPTPRAMAQDDQGGSVVGTWTGAATFDTPPGTPPFIEAELASIYPGGIVTGTSGITDGSDILKGRFTFQLTNLSGVQVLTGGGSVSLKRVAIEPLMP